jgi:hypothetical protein
VCAGVHDVAADGATDERGDHQEADGVRRNGLHQRIADRRLSLDGDERRQPDHHHAEEHHDPIHGHPRLAHEEDPDGHGGGDGGTQTYVESEDRVETQCAACDVADVEHQATEHV